MASATETIYNGIPGYCPDKQYLRAVGTNLRLHHYWAFIGKGGQVECLGATEAPICEGCPVRKPSYTVTVQKMGVFRVGEDDVKHWPTKTG